MEKKGLSLNQFKDDDIQPPNSTFRLRNSKNKKYVLHKMITKQQKQLLRNAKKKQVKQDPQYFAKMLKQQKKKMFVSTLIKKLKNSIILQRPPANYQSPQQENLISSYTPLILPKQVQTLLSCFIFIQTIPLLILNSLSLIFTQIQNHQIYMIYNTLSMGIHLLELVKRIFYMNSQDEKKIQSLTQKLRNYIYSEDFALDFAVTLGFLGIFIAKNIYPQGQTFILVFKILILFKINAIIYLLSYIEITLIQNQYRAQIWSLCKVFLFNFVIAHFLTILLISMTHLNIEHNWIVVKSLQNSNWLEVYIWGYYWATTIMLTVGFGDIVPTNKNEALCMIFIETMSCIVLAYNINRVGSIISKIRSYDEQKNQSMKVFNQISEKTQISHEVEAKITNYIKQSSVIKRNYNIQQQKNFITKLPSSFKDQLLKDMNKKIWYGMIFFHQLSQKSVFQLSKFLQKKLTHPDQIVYTRGQQVEIMIFNSGSFGFAYNSGKSKLNGKIIQSYNVKSNEFRIASLDFLLNQNMNYDVKCLDYVIFYQVSIASLLQVIQNHSSDYQYYFMTKDKDKFLLNQFQIQKCVVCVNQRHTSFKCARLHYIPTKQQVIQRFKKNLIKKVIQRVNMKLRQQLNHSLRSALKQRKLNRQQLLKKRVQYSINRMDSLQQLSQQSSDHIFQFKAQMQYNQAISLGYSNNNNKYYGGATFLDGAVEKIRKNMSRTNPDGDEVVWDVQCDIAKNYQYYFKYDNPHNILQKRNKYKLQNNQ